jgi:hypothetical protein
MRIEDMDFGCFTAFDNIDLKALPVELMTYDLDSKTLRSKSFNNINDFLNDSNVMKRELLGPFPMRIGNRLVIQFRDSRAHEYFVE